MKGGFELGVIGGAEGGPVEGGFKALAIGCAKPEFDGDFAFAKARVFLEREAFGQLDL